MGSCFGRCLPKSESPNNAPAFNLLTNNESIDFTFLLDKDRLEGKNVKRNRFLRFFSKRKENRQPKKPVLELVDELLNPQVAHYSRLKESSRLPSTGSCTSHDIPLQCLDARALMAKTASSTPTSLDLEWEHETLPGSMIHDPSGSSWAVLPEGTPLRLPSDSSPQNTAGHGSDSDWSRVSSANSLEWDSVQNSLQISPPASEIDTDTQLLLCEIERLTTQTLSETGLDLRS